MPEKMLKVDVFISYCYVPIVYYVRCLTIVTVYDIYVGKINLINDSRLLDWRSCSLTSILYTAYDSPPSEKYI